MSNRTELKITTGDLLSVADTAKELGRPRITIYRWIEAQKIIAVKFGGILFVPVSEVERLKKEKQANEKK